MPTPAAKPSDYQTLPLELFSVADLTDALGIEKSAELFKTTKRAIYTVRNTNVLSPDRASVLIEEIRKNETRCRQSLMQKRNLQYIRANAHKWAEEEVEGEQDAEGDTASDAAPDAIAE